jgi:hypothetical protein
VSGKPWLAVKDGKSGRMRKASPLTPARMNKR